MNEFYVGLGTHFNGWVSPERLAFISERVTSCRLDVQKSSSEDARKWMADVRAHDMHPLPIVDTAEQQNELEDGGWVELQNEVNIGLGRPRELTPAEYLDNIIVAHEIALRKGQTLCAGAAANMERRDIRWFHDLRFKDLPKDIIAVTHHYVRRDRFEDAHHIEQFNPATWTRQYEVDAFREAIGLDRDWIITEMGYYSGPPRTTRLVLPPSEMPERNRMAREMKGDDYPSVAHAAAQYAKEWPFWRKQPHCRGVWPYQIQDSPVDDHDFGLFDEHGNIKKAIWFTFPLRKETPMPEEPKPEPTPVEPVKPPKPTKPPKPPKPPKVQHDAVINASAEGAKGVFGRKPFAQFNGAKGLVPGNAPGKVAILLMDGESVLCVTPQGKYETRPKTAIGPWESGTKISTGVVYNSDGNVWFVPYFGVE